MENQQSTESSDDQNNNDELKHIDPNIASQVLKETALQKSNKQIAIPTKDNKLSIKESREKGRQQINKGITKYADTAIHLGKKRSAK